MTHKSMSIQNTHLSTLEHFSLQISSSENVHGMQCQIKINWWYLIFAIKFQSPEKKEPYTLKHELWYKEKTYKISNMEYRFVCKGNVDLKESWHTDNWKLWDVVQEENAWYKMDRLQKERRYHVWKTIANSLILYLARKDQYWREFTGFTEFR